MAALFVVPRPAAAPSSAVALVFARIVRLIDGAGADRAELLAWLRAHLEGRAA